MTQQDSLQRFIFEHANIRGEIVHLDETYQTIIHQHAYPEAIKQLLGEALAACALLTASIKFEGEISLQFQGDKRLPLLIVQCNHQLQIRGFAQYQNEPDIDYKKAFLDGKMVITIHQDNTTQSYQSVLPLNSTNMSENIMHYFAQSEQLSTRVWLAVNQSKATGMLMQLMPGQDTEQREQFWEYAIQLGQTLSKNELLSLDNETILHRLYHETELRLFTARPVQFRCRCTADKMKQVLSILGEQDAQQLLSEKGMISVHCEFCNRQYQFDAIDVSMFFRQDSP